MFKTWWEIQITFPIMSKDTSKRLAYCLEVLTILAPEILWPISGITEGPTKLPETPISFSAAVHGAPLAFTLEGFKKNNTGQLKGKVSQSHQESPTHSPLGIIISQYFTQ